MVTGFCFGQLDEALVSVEEVRRSLLTALVEGEISTNISTISMDGGKRYETSNNRGSCAGVLLNELKVKMCRLSRRDVKTINSGNERMAVTSVWGIGADAGSFAEKNSGVCENRDFVWLLPGRRIRSF